MGTVGAAGGERRSGAGEEGVIFALDTYTFFPSRSESPPPTLSGFSPLGFFCLVFVPIAWDRFSSVIAQKCLRCFLLRVPLPDFQPKIGFLKPSP